MPLALTICGVPSSVSPMKPILAPPRSADLVGREDRLARVLVDDVGGEELEVGAGEAVAVLAAIDRVAAAVLHAQQLVDALVELVVADGRDVETERVQAPRSSAHRGRPRRSAGWRRCCRRPRSRGSDPGSSPRSCLICVARYSTPPASVVPTISRGPRRWLQVAVEVVDRQRAGRCTLPGGLFARLGGVGACDRDEQRGDGKSDCHALPQTMLRGVTGWTHDGSLPYQTTTSWGRGGRSS